MTDRTRRWPAERERFEGRLADPAGLEYREPPAVAKAMAERRARLEAVRDHLAAEVERISRDYKPEVAAERIAELRRAELAPFDTIAKATANDVEALRLAELDLDPVHLRASTRFAKDETQHTLRCLLVEQRLARCSLSQLRLEADRARVTRDWAMAGALERELDYRKPATTEELAEAEGARALLEAVPLPPDAEAKRQQLDAAWEAAFEVTGLLRELRGEPRAFALAEGQEDYADLRRRGWWPTERKHPDSHPPLDALEEWRRERAGAPEAEPQLVEAPRPDEGAPA
jgi:hypothetical protein